MANVNQQKNSLNKDILKLYSKKSASPSKNPSVKKLNNEEQSKP
jgi:hypothetical protein